MEHIYYPSGDGRTTVHAVIWRPEGQPKAVLQIIHGMAEYAERYAPFAEKLALKGFLVCADDHLGHGQSVVSEDDLGYFTDGNAVDCVLGDIRKLTLTVKEECSAPYFIMGHSMGSFFCRKYISLYGSELAGAIIMGTGFQPSVATGAGKLISALIAAFRGWHYRSDFIDNLAFGSYNKKFENRTPYDWLSADRSNVDAYIADKLCGVKFTCSGFYTLFSIVGEACKGRTIKAVPKDLPLYLVAGEDDPVGGYSKGVKKLYDKLCANRVKDVQLTLYKGCRHEILNDDCAPQVTEDILEFLEARI
ncbi:MAG: alpha/beta fold hydrolase [Candidatus Coproplasma sp.]